MFHKDPCVFAGYPIDPLDELRGNEKILNSMYQAVGTRFIIYSDGSPMMDISAGLEPCYFNLSEIDVVNHVFLGKDENFTYFAAEVSNIVEEHAKRKYVALRSIAREVAANGFSGMPSLLAKGKMLLDWHKRHGFCANCSAETNCVKGGHSRFCDECDTEHFPRVDPVVIMMVVMGDKCLLGRSPHFLPGMYSALAGFMEPGENIEEAVRREVWEEAGIKVGKVDYIKSQPWPFPSSLMIGTICEALNEDINIDNDELEDAKWFDKKDLQEVLDEGGNDQFRVPERLAIARHLLEYHLLETWIRD